MTTRQFGRADPNLTYRDRPAAFGIVDRDSRVALVRVERPGQDPWFDLPGGALDEGETYEQAVVREVGEEAGLLVEVGERFAEANQYFVRDDGEAVNNLCVFFEAHFAAEDPKLKIEADHTLVWMPPESALAALRHEAHAWALHTLLRRLYQRP
jgi:8-oxo-dGTP diphosphatase